MLRRIERRKQRRNRLLMGLVLVFLMVFGMMGVFTYNDTGENYEYNGYEFRWNGKYFSTEIDGEVMQFYTIPQELQNINRSEAFSSTVRGQAFYLTFEPEQGLEELTYLDIIRNDIAKNTKSTVISAITKPSETYALPIINCSNATAQVPVLKIKISNQTKIKIQDNCIFIKSRMQDLFKVRDLIIYTHTGVINE